MADTPRNTSTPPVTPALSTASLAEAAPPMGGAGSLDKVAPAASAPPVGTASGEPPSGGIMDTASVKRLIDEAVAEQVEIRMAEIKASEDPSREDFDEGGIPFAAFNKKLEIWAENPLDPLPGFVLYWANDDGDRIMRMQTQGYALVKREEIALNASVVPLNKDLGDYIAVYAGNKEGGHPLRTYLMKCPKDIYDKRKAWEQRHNDKIEQAIREGAVGNPQAGYVPRSTPIKYEPRKSVAVRFPFQPN